jgi:hypothetical protein
LIADDLPALERPAKAISDTVGGGNCASVAADAVNSAPIKSRGSSLTLECPGPETAVPGRGGLL